MKIFPVFIPFAGCQSRCIYCQQNLITKTICPDFNKIREQLSVFCRKNSDQEKEIAFFGGSFTLLSEEKQRSLLKEIAPYTPLVNGIRISTRPDGITPETLDFLAKEGIKTIELGIQSFSDSVLKKTGRPYNSEQARDACSLIKDTGFRLGIQLMPGLPGETEVTIMGTTEQTIDCKPDFVRIYPTLVLRDTELEKIYRAGEYKPMTLEKGIEISADISMKLREHGIRVIKTGLHSDLSIASPSKPKREDDTEIPQETRSMDLTDSVVAGPYHPAFGELVSREILFRNIVDSYQNGKTFAISRRAKSLLKRDDRYLIKKIKKTLPIEIIPIIFTDDEDKERVQTSELDAEYYW